MPGESRADRLEALMPFERARFADVLAPCQFSEVAGEEYGVVGHQPVIMVAGTRLTASTFTLYGLEGGERTVTIGDTVAQVWDHEGEEQGPFTVRRLAADGFGFVNLLLEAQ